MNRTQKAAEIENLKTRFSKSQLTILAEYKGLSVASMTELRRKLKSKDQNAAFKVVKNRLAKIAVKGTPAELLQNYFVGTIGIATSETEPTWPAKVLINFAKDNEKLKIKTGFLDGKAIDFSAIKMLASLPSKEELIAKMLGSLNAPATNLVSVLVQIPRQLLTVLSAIKDQKGSQQ